MEHHIVDLADLGVDGWWPDQGDGLDGPSRLNRHRMYWEGMQQLRPDERPFALHRNGRLFPPNYLHESWMDYLYWDVELDA